MNYKDLINLELQRRWTHRHGNSTDHLIDIIGNVLDDFESDIAKMQDDVRALKKHKHQMSEDAA